MSRVPLLAISLPLGLLMAQTGSPNLTADMVRDQHIRTILSTLSSGRIADIAVDPRNRSVW